MSNNQAAIAEDYRRSEEGLSSFLFEPSTRQPSAVIDGRLLVCLDDGPQSDSILNQALAVAKGLDLNVTAARVLETPRHLSVPADPLEWQIRRKQGLDCLDRLVAGPARGGTKIDRVLLAGPSADELTGWAKANDVTLMALGTHDRSGGRRGLGGTTQKVMEWAAASLLLVPAQSAGRLPYRRILAPLDGSQRAESVLPLAARIASAHGAELVLTHVVPPAPAIGEGSLKTNARALCARLGEQNEQGARDYLDALEARLWKERLPVRAMVVRRGDPRTELVRLAHEQRADLVIVASHGASGMTDVPCGSVTEYLATHSAVPLLIVRPDFAHVFASPAPTANQGARTVIPQSA